MDAEVDHYLVLDLPSGEEGAKLTEKEISKAYKKKALELHPDKRRDDPNAHDNFQKLKTSYEILKDERARKLFDDLLRVKHEKQQRDTQYDAKRRRMVSDLERREKDAFAPDPSTKARTEEERIKKKLQEEIARIRAMHAKGANANPAAKQETRGRGGANAGSGAGINLDKEKILKVTWENVGGDYSASRLREEFGQFGEVEDVLIKSSKKKGSAVVVMSSKEAAIAATKVVVGDLSNPLLVMPLQPATTSPFMGSSQPTEDPTASNLVGAQYQAFEDSVLEKLRKAAPKRQADAS